jgi:hypothetical protein
VPWTLWFQAVENACGEAAKLPLGSAPPGGSVVEGAGVVVDASVEAGAVVAVSVDEVDVGLVGGSVVAGRGVVVDGSVGGAVVGGCVDGSVGAGAVVGGCVDGSVGGGAVVGGVVGPSVDDVGSSVVVGCVVVVLLSWASCVTMRRTAAPCVYSWLGVVVVVSSVEGAVAVDELLLEAALAISRPAPTSTPPTNAGTSI